MLSLGLFSNVIFDNIVNFPVAAVFSSVVVAGVVVAATAVAVAVVVLVVSNLRCSCCFWYFYC